MLQLSLPCVNCAGCCLMNNEFSVPGHPGRGGGGHSSPSWVSHLLYFFSAVMRTFDALVRAVGFPLTGPPPAPRQDLGPQSNKGTLQGLQCQKKSKRPQSLGRTPPRLPKTLSYRPIPTTPPGSPQEHTPRGQAMRRRALSLLSWWHSFDFL